MRFIFLFSLLLSFYATNSQINNCSLLKTILNLGRVIKYFNIKDAPDTAKIVLIDLEDQFVRCSLTTWSNKQVEIKLDTFSVKGGLNPLYSYREKCYYFVLNFQKEGRAVRINILQSCSGLIYTLVFNQRKGKLIIKNERRGVL